MTIKHFLTNNTPNKQVLNCCQNSSKPIAMMPAGRMAIAAKKYLAANNVEIDFFIDNSRQKHNTNIGSKPVLSFEKYKRMAVDYTLLIITRNETAGVFKEQLEENNIPPDNYKIFDETQAYLVEMLLFTPEQIDDARNIILKDMEKYTSVYNLLEKSKDELSLNTFIAILNYRITHNSNFLTSIICPENNIYFEDDIYKIKAYDYFVDCGAFTGDTLESLMRNIENNIEAYYAFEPDARNFISLKEKVGKYNIKYPLCFQKGAYSKEGNLCFEDRGDATSKINDKGEIKISVIDLDTALKDKKITFIKMDIEGSEYESLIGAKDIIQDQKPVLAISVYHKFQDIWQLPLLIDSFGVNYNYYIRHYTIGTADTVLYAVPKT